MKKLNISAFLRRFSTTETTRRGLANRKGLGSSENVIRLRISHKIECFGFFLHFHIRRDEISSMYKPNLIEYRLEDVLY